jgi:putative dimethyl sulfoxide reductase chaperone
MSNESLIVMTNKEFIFFEHARASAFNMLTALLCQPEEQVVEESAPFDTLRSALEIVYPDGTPCVDRLQAALQQYTFQELLVEYTRLFIGPFKTPVSPYSSLYFGTDRVMDDTTLWVMECYKKAGLEFNYDIKDVPDHITVETEFMYYLIHSEIKELDAGRQEAARACWENQQEFFGQHYRKWVPQFCAKIAAETKNVYFKTLSTCVKSFIDSVEIPPFPTE